MCWYSLPEEWIALIDVLQTFEDGSIGYKVSYLQLYQRIIDCRECSIISWGVGGGVGGLGVPKVIS